MQIPLFGVFDAAVTSRDEILISGKGFSCGCHLTFKYRHHTK